MKEKRVMELKKSRSKKWFEDWYFDKWYWYSSEILWIEDNDIKREDNAYRDDTNWIKY